MEREDNIMEIEKGTLIGVEGEDGRIRGWGSDMVTLMW